jgi:Tol biopolymer transport system component
MNDVLQNIIDENPEELFTIADGFDDAILGYDSNNLLIIYSVKKCIEILMGDDEMSFEDAMEYFTFNVSGSYVGEKTPIWCNDL